MYKVIVYGVYAIELRRQIEHFLDDDYSIIGYTDAFLDEDNLDGKRFISIEEIEHIDYDYVVLAIVQNREGVANNLAQYGVPQEKIIFPEILHWSNGAKLQRNIVHEIDICTDDDIEGLIFGLSYSRRGIVQRNLELKCFNFSIPGLDIYYNAMLYKYTQSNRPDLLKGVKYAFWVMPYYYFDYDMSVALSQYTSGQICAMALLGDWHNAPQTVQIRRYIESFKMFSRKVLLFYNSPGSPIVRKVWDGENRGSLLGSWHRQYKETCEENLKILKDVFCDLKEHNCKTIIVIPPMYVGGMNSISKKAFYEKQKFFLNICENNFDGLELWDYSEEYKDQKMFFDSLDHLNIYGAKAFTETLNNRILEKCDIRR